MRECVGVSVCVREREKSLKTGHVEELRNNSFELHSIFGSHSIAAKKNQR